MYTGDFINWQLRFYWCWVNRRIALATKIKLRKNLTKLKQTFVMVTLFSLNQKKSRKQKKNNKCDNKIEALELLISIFSQNTFVKYTQNCKWYSLFKYARMSLCCWPKFIFDRPLSSPYIVDYFWIEISSYLLYFRLIWFDLKLSITEGLFISLYQPITIKKAKMQMWVLPWSPLKSFWKEPIYYLREQNKSKATQNSTSYTFKRKVILAK